ncbi:MAG: response regulator [Myxococcales bacterium]|nr:response regulator [Myxococcales bacterium]MCB9717135.1 response regulator [Myxococcales bacterium]
MVSTSKASDEAGAELPSDVLVVDDDPSNLAAIEEMLRELGVRVTASRSGEECLRHLVHHRFAVVLLDINLPGLSGFETARLIRSREHSRHVPIIFITAQSQEEQQIRRGYELGAVDYLFKPVVPEVLRAKVKVFVELRNRTEEAARQAERLREAERTEAIRRLQIERRRWEADELRRQVEQQRLINDELSKLDRRKDEFIALLAHELRNPLVPLVTGLHLIESREPEDPVIVEVRERMARQVAHLERLVGDLLDFARIGAGRLELDLDRIDLRAVVERACEMCRDEIARRGQVLVVEGPPEPVEVRADLVRMTQVVSNLLNNASRYSEGGDRIWMRWGAEDGEAFLRVTDEGRGIAPEFIDHVFDTFARERREGGGLGLGLALVRELVDEHGGTVEAASDGPGHGSEFVVRLPTLDARRSSASPPRPRSPTPIRVPLRVVLVEDHADIRDLVARLVESWGHSVVGVAGTGAEAIECMLRERPDVAVVDIGLPDIDGYEVARRVCHELGLFRPGLVAMSGYGQEQDVRRAHAAGFDLHLVKPPDPGELCDAIEQAHMGRPRMVTGRRHLVVR